ncbi:MAG: Hsp20/alpha crystallin family protein [Kovacikia sp.]
MSLIRWKPLKELDTLRHQMNHLFDELMHGEREFGQFPKLENTVWAPAIELKETDTELILKAVVPGIEAKELDVQISENTISIAGEHREEKRTEEKGYFRSELQYGQFQRIVPLPVSVKHEQVRHEFKDGVLTLTLPKAESSSQKVTKVDLKMSEKAREAATELRQHDEQLEEKVHTRAAETISAPTKNGIQEEARELAAEQRLHDDHLQETTHQRAVDEISK